MFDIGWTEMLVIAVVMIVVVGPKDLPRMLRTTGRSVSKLRSMAGDFQRQFNEALKEAELDDVKKSVDELRGLNPTAQIRKAVNPFEKAAADVRAGLESLKQPAPPKPAAAETHPAEPLKAGATAMPESLTAAGPDKMPEPVKVDAAIALASAAAEKPVVAAKPAKAPRKRASEQAASAKAAPAKAAVAKPAAVKPSKPRKSAEKTA